MTRVIARQTACRRKLPPELQLKLAADSAEGVRSALAANANATGQVLDMVAQDPDESVRAVARERWRGDRHLKWSPQGERLAAMTVVIGTNIRRGNWARGSSVTKPYLA